MALQTTYSQNPGTALVGQFRVGAKLTSLKNANASAPIPVGAPVARKNSSPTSDLDALSVANSTDLIDGIVAHQDDYSPAFVDTDGTTKGQLDGATNGIVAGALMSVVREGWVWVPCHTGCAPGDRLYVSYSAGSTYSAAGQLGNAAESSHTIDASAKGEWQSTAGAGANAWLELHAYNK